MANGLQDKEDQAFLDALAKEKKLTEIYTKGKVSREEHYQQVVKAWSSVLSSTLSVFIVVSTALVGIFVFLIVMLYPVLD